MPVNSTTIDNLMDQVFARPEIGEIYPQVFSKCWNKIKKADSKNINQKGGFYLTRTRIPDSTQSSDFQTGAGGLFPLASSSDYVLPKVLPITDRGTVEFDGNVEAQNEARLKQSPAKQFDYIMADVEGEQISYGRAKSRQLWDNGSNELARVTAINTGTRTITCNISAGNLFGVQLINPGSLVEFRDGAGTLRGGTPAYVRVESTNRGAMTFTYTADFAAPAGIVANDVVYPANSYNNAWKGVGSFLATTGAYQGITDRTVFPQMIGTRINGSNGVLNLALLRRAQSGQYMRRSGDDTSKGTFYGSAQWDAYEATGYAVQMYGQSGDTMKQGFRQLFFDDTPFEKDYFVQRDKIFKIDWTKIDKFELKRYEPLRDNTGYVQRVQLGGQMTDKKQIIMQGFGNLGAEIPAAVGTEIFSLSTSGLALGND